MELSDRNLGRGHYEPASALLDAEDDLGEFLPPSRLRRSRRSRFEEPVLNITSFVDVLSVLMFFLLSVVTLQRLGTHDVALPRASDSFSEESNLEVRNLTLALARKNLTLRALIVPEEGEPEALNREFPLVDESYDVEALQEELLRLKGAYETDESLILMVGDDVHFDWIVKVMDATRERVVYANGRREITTLFPDVSLSDYTRDVDLPAPAEPEVEA